MNTIRPFVKQYPLPIFFILALGLPWLCAPLADAIFYSGLPTLLAIALALPFEVLVASPLLAALIVTAITTGKTGVKSLLHKFTQWRIGWGWYAVALLFPPALSLVAAYLNMLWGAPLPTLTIFGSGSSLLLAFALRLINPWDGPLMEELGWRGFALPHLQARYSPLTANLILAGLVMIWHLRYVFSGDLPLFALLGTLAATILFGWLYNNTQGSVLLAYLFHAADGVLKPNYTGVDSVRYLWLLVAMWCVAALVVILTTRSNLARRKLPDAAPDTGQPVQVFEGDAYRQVIDSSSRSIRQNH